jgi:hypothetical protein
MQWIFVGICFFGTIVAAIFVKSLDLNSGLTAAIIIPLVFLVIYSLARIGPKKPATKKVSDMERVAEISEKGAHA